MSFRTEFLAHHSVNSQLQHDEIMTIEIFAGDYSYMILFIKEISKIKTVA